MLLVSNECYCEEVAGSKGGRLALLLLYYLSTIQDLARFAYPRLHVTFIWDEI